MLQSVFVAALQVAVGITVRLPPELATNTFPSAVSSATASGPEPVGTGPDAEAKSVGLLALPSLSTVTVLLDLSAM